MSKHTPGPWRYTTHGVDSNYMLITCSSDPQESDNLRGYCEEANARLIAAAPDLLEALERCAEHLNRPAAWTQEEEDLLIDLVTATIAKATGEKS